MTKEKWLQLKPGDLITITEPQDAYNGASFMVISRNSNAHSIIAEPMNTLAQQAKFRQLSANTIYTKFEATPSEVIPEPRKKTITNRLANL